MERYLVFDSGCAVCTQLAETVQSAADGKLEVISIHDTKAKTLLNQAHPGGWDPAPYLVFVGRGGARAWTGPTAAVRLAVLAGPRGAWRIWIAARRQGIYLPPDPKAAASGGVSRRRFLQLSVGATTALAAVGLLPSKAFACAPCETCGFSCRRSACGNGPGDCRRENWACYDARTGEFCYYESRLICGQGYC